MVQSRLIVLEHLERQLGLLLLEGVVALLVVLELDAQMVDPRLQEAHVEEGGW